MEHLLLQWQGMVLHHPRLWWECLCFHQDRWCLHHQVDLVSNYFCSGFYCMASSVSGQDNPNPALWLAVQAGKMALSWPLRTTHCVLQERIARKPYNKSLIDQAWSITHMQWLTVMHTVSIKSSFEVNMLVSVRMNVSEQIGLTLFTRIVACHKQVWSNDKKNTNADYWKGMTQWNFPRNLNSMN